MWRKKYFWVVGFLVGLSACALGPSPTVQDVQVKGSAARVLVLPSAAWLSRARLDGQKETAPNWGKTAERELMDVSLGLLSEELGLIPLEASWTEGASLRSAAIDWLRRDGPGGVFEVTQLSGHADYALQIFAEGNYADRSNRAAQFIVNAFLLAPARPRTGAFQLQGVLIDLSSGNAVWRGRVEGYDIRKPSKAKAALVKLFRPLKKEIDNQFAT